MNITEQKKNNCKILKILDHVKDDKPENIQGYDYLQSSNIYQLFLIFANRNSGKTTMIANLLKSILNNNCETCYIFSATMWQDPIYKVITKTLEKKGINVIMRDSFMIDKKISYIDEFVRERDEEKERLENPEPEPEPIKKTAFIKFSDETDTDKPEKTKKIKKDKKRCCRFMFLFDDMTNLTRSNVVDRFIKRLKHYESSAIISSQYPLDVLNSTFTNANKLILYAGYSDQILKKIYIRVATNYTFEQFKEIYLYCVSTKYNFLLYNFITQDFYKNFDTLLKIECE